MVLRQLIYNIKREIMARKKKSKEIIKEQPQEIYNVIVQQWAEFEGNNIAGFANFSVHLDGKDKDDFVNTFWEREKIAHRGQMPFKFIRNEGESISIQTNKSVYKRLQELRKQGKFGLWIETAELLDPKRNLY